MSCTPVSDNPFIRPFKIFPPPTSSFLLFFLHLLFPLHAAPSFSCPLPPPSPTALSHLTSLTPYILLSFHLPSLFPFTFSLQYLFLFSYSSTFYTTWSSSLPAASVPPSFFFLIVPIPSAPSAPSVRCPLPSPFSITIDKTWKCQKATQKWSILSRSAERLHSYQINLM